MYKTRPRSFAPTWWAGWGLAERVVVPLPDRVSPGRFPEEGSLMKE